MGLTRRPGSFHSIGDGSDEPTGIVGGSVQTSFAAVDLSLLQLPGIGSASQTDNASFVVRSALGGATGVGDVVFIDSRVPDIQDLLNGLKPGEKAFVIDGGSDGLGQIAAILKSQHLGNLTGIQIVSHGASGALELGSTTLDDSDLASHASALASIGAALAAGGNLSLYACDVAQGATGQQFIADLSHLAGGVDVAASTQAIGLTAAGENWTLDATVGANSAAAPIADPFTAAAEANFSGTLATPTTELWIAATGGGDQNLIIHSDNTGNNTASNIGELFSPGSANNPTDVNPNALIDGIDLIQLDTQDGLYFIANQNNEVADAPAVILKGSLTSALANPTATPTYTTLFSTTALGAITGIAVDPDNAEVYFEFGHNFEKVSYNGGAATTLGSPSDGSFLDGIALDLPHHVAYFLSGTSNTTTTTTKNGLPDRSDPNGNIHYITVFTGSIYETSNNLTSSSGANSVTITKLIDVPGSDGAPANGVGTVGIAVDTVTGRLFFTTKSVVDQHIEGGVFWIDPTDPTHTIHTIFRQTGTAGSFIGNGVLQSIEVDDATGKYYVSVLGSNGEGGAVYVGNLSDSNVQPTLFETMPTFSNGTIQPGSQGFSIDNAPVLTATVSNPTFTESTSNPASSNNTPVTLITSATVSDTDNDKVASATVALTGSFTGSGDSLYVLDGSTHRTSGIFTGTGITVSETTDVNGNETLTLSGVDTLAHYQTVLNDVQFTSSSDDPTDFGAHISRTVSFTVNDGLLNSTAVTSTVTVVGVNDPPVNHLPGAQTANEDASHAITGVSVTDPDADPANQAIIVALSVAHGTLTIPTNVAGGLTAAQVVGNGGGTVTLTATQNEINATMAAANGLVYLGLANYNGPDTLTVTSNDQGFSGTGGALQTQNTVAITVNAVDDPPAGADNSKTILEDNPYTFAAADFGFSDPIDAANGVHGADSLLAVKITTLASAGTLTDNGVAVTAGQFVSVADITGNHLVFAPVANANGANYSHFTFQVQDNGGTANGGIDTDQSPNTFTFNVTPVNDPPAGANNSKTINEDASYTFAAADFGFTDPNDSPANNLLAVKITTLPGAGTLTDNGVAVTAGQAVAVADITGNHLVFTPAANANGANYASFTFQVQDDGGTANGGIDTDQTPNTFTFNVTSINDAPAGADNSKTISEDAAYTFAAADFGFTDPNDSPANSLLAVKITTLPGAGTLTDNGVAVTAGQAIAVADINGNHLVFTPAANANGANYASFTFQVQDNGGTANGGVDTDQSPNTFAFNVTSVNDAPAGADNSKTISEDAAYTFAAADFGFTDPNDSPANTLLAVKITTLPGAGTLTDNGVAVTAGQFVSLADITGNHLVFTPASNANGANYASFTFQVQDNGGIANGGVDTDPTPNNFTFNVTSVNDAPIGTANTVTTLEDTSYVFGVSDFGFTDPNDSPANSLKAVEITTLPGGGALTDNKVAVTAGQFVSAADITGGLLHFTPTANANGLNEASFTFQVQDNGGTANGGVDTDPTPKTLTVNVTSVNDAPAGADNTVTTDVGADYTFHTADFGFTDSKDNPANNLLAVQIDTAPAHGTLNLNATPVDFSHGPASISAADIAAGLLTFHPDPGFPGPDSGLTFQVQDDGGTANGGVDLDQSANTLTIDVRTANAAPAGTDGSVETHQDSPYHFVAADFGFTDPGDTPANHFVAVEITTGPTVGTLTDNGSAVTNGQFVSVADINGGLLVFTPAAGDAVGANYDSLTFQVQDDGSLVNGGQNVDPTPNTLTINIEGANHAPAGADTTRTINEDAIYTFAASDFGFTDPNDTPADHLLAVDVTSVPLAGAGTLTDNGSVVTNGELVSVADINANKLVFTPTANANGSPEASFTFQVQDNGGTANGGVDTDPAPKTFAFDVTPVNDAPIGTANTVTTNEDTPYTFAAADFGFTDPNDSPANSLKAVEIATLASAGTLTDNGVAVTAGQFVSVADITSGLLVFTPAANANGSNYSHFTFQVQDDGGTANGGVDTDPSPKTLTVNVTPVNDAPAGADNSRTINEDASYTFATSDFGFTDPNDSPANSLKAVEIATLASAGTLTDNGVAVTAGQFVPVADISGGLLVLTPAANANGSNYSHFTFQVQDNGGTANGGVDTDPTPNTFTLNVTSVNDAPVGTTGTVTTLEDASFVFGAADFGFTDPNDSPANSLKAVEITTLASAGTLTDNGVAVTAGQFVSAADITGGLLVFTPAANASGSNYAHLTFQVQDNGGTANGGIDTDPSPKTLTVDVTPVNDAPVGTAGTVTTLEDTSFVFGVNDFGFTDPNDSPANSLLAVEITTLPGAGILTDHGIAVTAGQFVSVADISGGSLAFTPGANGSGGNYSHFTFQVQDDGGTANGGVDIDPSPKTLTVNVTPVNDAPAGTDTTVTTLEDTAFVFGAGNFGFTDPNDNPANNLLAVEITTLPGAGILTDHGVAVTAGQFVSAADIAGGLLVFTPAANANGSNYAHLTFQVQDDGGTANGGIDTDPSPNTLTINVTPVNDAPVLANVAASAAYAPGGGPVILSPALTVNDIDDADLASATVVISSSSIFLGDVLAIDGVSNGALPDFSHLSVTYNAGNGTLTLTGNDTLSDYQAALQTVTFESVNATPTNGGANASRTITWQLNDGEAAHNLSDPQATTISLHVLDLDANDSTVSGTAFVTTFTEQGAAAPVADTDVNINDVDATTMASATVTLTDAKLDDNLGIAIALPSGITSSVDTSVAGKITLTLHGTASTAAYQQALQDVVFSNASNNPDISDRDVAIVVTDTQGISTNTADATIHVVAVNDPPVATITQASYSAIEQTLLSLKSTGLSVSDVDDNGGIETATLTVGEGTLNITAGDSGVLVSNDGTSSVTINGTLAEINALLGAGGTSTLNFIDDTDGPSPSTLLTLTIDDLGNTGIGGAQTRSTTTTINITPVNDPPTVTGTVAGQTITDHQTLPLFSGVTIADPDIPAQTETVSVTLDHPGQGAFTAASLTASGFAANNAIAGEYDFLGTAAASTAAIQQLIFQPVPDTTPNPTETTTFTIAVSDGALSATDSHTSVIVSDTTPPAAPSTPDLSSASDSGVSNTDNLTNVTTPTFTGSAEAGSTVTLFDTNGTTVLGSAVATGGTYSITTSTLSDGLHTVTAHAADAAGNVSSLSGPLTVDIDTTAPGAPALALAHDTGFSATDHITSDPTFNFTAAEAGGTLLFQVDGGAFSATAPAFATNGSADGPHTVSVEQQDDAGNIGSTASFNFTLDTTAPHVATITASPSSGDLEPGATVNFVFNFNEAVKVSGGTPTLSLNTGGTATYDAAATAALNDPTKLVFDHLISASESGTPSLAITGLDPHGAIVADLAGNPGDLSHVSADFNFVSVGEAATPPHLQGFLLT